MSFTYTELKEDTDLRSALQTRGFRFSSLGGVKFYASNPHLAITVYPDAMSRTYRVKCFDSGHENYFLCPTKESIVNTVDKILTLINMGEFDSIWEM